MKKALKGGSIAFAAVLTLSAMAAIGTGCSEDKKIADPQKFIEEIKNNPQVDISLSSDLDFTGIEWEPLEYHGTLNGNGHTISNITITKNEGSSIGIFSYGQLSVENLEIENLSVNYFGEGKYIGGLVGYWGVNKNDFDNVFDEYIKDVKISGTVNAMGATYVGGVVGYQADGESRYEYEDDGGYSFYNVVSRMEVSGGSNVGGIVGRFSWEEDWQFSRSDFYNGVKNVKNYGSVTAIKEVAGGIVGETADLAKYEGCVNYGEVKAQVKAGGIVGNAALTELVGCSNEGKVRASGKTGLLEEGYAGGIVGYQTGGRIVECVNKGETSAKHKTCGGIVGCMEDGKEILACTNSGAVDGDTYIGGIAGSLKGANMLVSVCKNEGEIRGNNFIAGLIGGCLSNIGSIISNETLIASITNCENAGNIYGNGEWIDPFCGGVIWPTGTSENNTNTGELYRNGVRIEQ